MAQATGNFIPLISASQGAISYLADASSTALTGALSSITSVTDRQVIMVKDMKVTICQEEAERIDLLGKESTTAGTGVLNTGTFQNQIFDIKSVSEAELSCTIAMTLSNDGSAAKLPDFLELVSGTGQAISTTHHRHTFGDSATSQKKVLTGLIFVVWDDGTRGGVAAFLNPVVNWTEIGATGTDGYFEIQMTAKSLAKNFAIEVKDQDT